MQLTATSPTQTDPTVTAEMITMDRLGFTLADFTRVAWASEAARGVWQPRLARVVAAWSEVEWRSVVSGVRRCAVANASPEDLLERAPVWAESGLGALPVEMTSVTGQPYSATSEAHKAGDPFVFRLVVGSPNDLAAFKRAWDDADDEAIGVLLGYPSCCRAFFRRVWLKERMVDTTWPMAIATAERTGPALPAGTTVVEVDGPAEANILWRWMGVRAVPHLPCRFDCEATTALGEQLVAVGRDCAMSEEMDWLVEILSWPIEWSALHGIAEIRTPVLKVSTRTDATPSLYTVRRGAGAVAGSPAAGAASAPQVRPDGDWYASDNGFASLSAMRSAHQPIIDLAADALGDSGGSVLDLGCGNGALLQSLVTAAAGVVPYGVDLDPGHIEHARALQPEFATHFRVGDLFDVEDLWSGDRRFDLAIVMPGRLLEALPRQAEALRDRLRRQCGQVLLYTYDDWLGGSGSLVDLARRAGFEVSCGQDCPAALASFAAQSTEGDHVSR